MKKCVCGWILLFLCVGFIWKICLKCFLSLCVSFFIMDECFGIRKRGLIGCMKFFRLVLRVLVKVIGLKLMWWFWIWWFECV